VTILILIAANLIGSESPSKLRTNLETHPSCGVLALYSLLRLEGKPRTIDEIERILPNKDESGYSMLELKTAASKLGFELEGIKLNMNINVIQRPMIVFLQDSRHGHFLTLVPDKSSGKFVQVLDGDRAPQLLSTTEFAHTAGWTGLALVPPRFHFPFRLLGIAGLSLSFSLRYGRSVWRFLRSQRGHH
jgi:ABC-type bacteriocin/lantibiotic exporter with double-glycine peptidase domain